MNNETKYERFKHETIYLWEDESELYIKSVPGQGYYAKGAGKPEYKIAANTDAVTRAVAAMNEVSKSEYENA